jgi:hypothetical protein
MAPANERFISDIGSPQFVAIDPSHSSQWPFEECAVHSAGSFMSVIDGMTPPLDQKDLRLDAEKVRRVRADLCRDAHFHLGDAVDQV